MEQPQKSVDRILQALAPMMAEELERAVQEALRQQEEAFRGRLEAAVLDAEQEARNSAAARLEQALEEVRQEVRHQAAAEFESRSNDGLKLATDGLAAQFGLERAKLQEETDMWRVFAEAQRELSGSGSQAEMLTRFLNFAEPFAMSIAVYVPRSGGLTLWKSRGPAVFAESPLRNAIDPDSYFRAVVVRDRSVAAVSAEFPFKAEPLDYLVDSLARSIEAFGLKLQAPIPRVPVGI